MRRPSALQLTLALALLAPPAAHAAATLNDTLSFELPSPPGSIAGWYSWPDSTVFVDSAIVHGGRQAVRFTRGPASLQSFSGISRTLPARFAGDTLELRGWLRTADVAGGFAGLWLREDGRSGSLQFDNMENRKIAGTTPWTEYRIRLPLDPKARSLVYGALLVGTGTAHVDNLQLLVDDQPINEAPLAVRETTAVDRDHEFDAGSRIMLTRPSPIQIENLVLLGKVWGFVKYHHSRVTAGRSHWDYELFRAVPAVLASKSRAEAERALMRWLDRLGDPEPCDSCAKAPDSVHLQPRIDWIRDRERLGVKLSERLQLIHARRSTNPEQYYVQGTSFVGNPDFSSEAAYRRPELPDPGYRLLAVFRFWNMIEYWFPDRDLIREDWDGVLREFVPRVLAAGTTDDYQLTMMAFIAHAHDTHANLWSALDVRPPRGECQLPVALRWVENKFVVSAFADSVLGPASGLEVGDVIESLDGAPVESLVVAWTPYYCASNEASRRRDLANSLTHGPIGPCRVGGTRAGQPFERTVARDSTSRMNWRIGSTHDLPGPTFRLLDPDVAYLKLSTVTAADAERAVRAAAGTKCLVVDIRNYPSVFMVFELGKHLMSAPTPFVRFTVGDLTNPGAFKWTPPLSITPEAPRYEGRVVILVDEISQSQAEYTAMALRAAPGALVVGSTTAGADGNVSSIRLPGGLYTMISGIGIFYPDRTPTQQIGIVPDLVVRPTIEGIRTRHDEVLEAAIEKVLGRKLSVPIP